MPPMMRIGVFKKHGSQDDCDVKTNGREFFDALSLYRKKGILAVSLILTMAAGATPFLMNFVMGDFLTIMTGSNRSFLETIKPILYNMIYIVIAMSVVMALGIGGRVFANPYFMADLRAYCFRSLMELDIQYYDDTATGILISRLSEDITLIRETYIDKFFQAIQSLTQAAVGVVIALSVCWRIALCVMPAIPLAACAFVIGDRIVDKLWFSFNENQSENASQAEEVISQFRTVKAFDGEMGELARYESGLDSVRKVLQTAGWVHGAKDGIIQFAVWGMMALLQYLAMSFMIRRPYIGLEAGDMMILQMSCMQSVMGVSAALGTLEDLAKAAISTAKVLNIIHRKPEVDRNEGDFAINGEDQVEGKIEFKDVGFRYKTREDWAVRHLSFTIEKGQTVAIVGESGSGKSTTLQLLQRFYEIQEGQILIDGVDLRELAPAFVRSNIASVPQTPVLFTMSIRDNIRYSVPDSDDTAVAEAASTGNAHDFILELPSGYDTLVQQGALSGGQKQRVCISRAILQNAPILILDEATAALDTESEHLVQESLEEVRHGKTAIVVAHRLATVINADRIFVMKDGRVVEEGTHKSLLALEGFYADLVKYQLQ